MIPFVHTANQLDQVDSKIKVVLHDQGEGYKQPITFGSESRKYL